MRLGLFGGTFDPIHLGHLILAEACREACALDQLWFIVTATPPHKQGQERTPVEHRLAMARLAIQHQPAFSVSEIEAHTTGPHYSYQTIEALRQDRPADDLFFLIGADSLADLPTWRHPERIARCATIVVVNRPSYGLENESEQSSLPDLGPGTLPLRQVTVPDIGISSTDLRHRLAEGRSIRFQTPLAVEQYISRHQLYDGPIASEKQL